jgi:hypothetical protein
MGDAGPPSPGGQPADDDDLDYYSPKLLLPLIVGAAALLAGAALIGGTHGRTEALVELLDGGVALVALGVITYFLIGLWLIPGSLLLGGIAFLSAYEVEYHLPQWGEAGGIVLAVLGALGLLQAAIATRRWLASRTP